VNEALATQFGEIVGAQGVAGDVVSPPDTASLAAVAHLCNQHGIAIAVTSGAPSTHDAAPEGGIVISVGNYST
jgi:FAD/FMN-containing dehydrogenase